MVFPITVFGKKEISFNANWYSKFPWLHYNMKSNYMYCYTCMTAHTKGHKDVSSLSGPVFITTGFCYWEKCGERFLDHWNSVIHKDYEGLVRLDEENADIDEQFQEQLWLEKTENCQLLLSILGNVQYLGRQGLAFQGNLEEGNFDQPMQLSSKTDLRVSKWLQNKRNVLAITKMKS